MKYLRKKALSFALSAVMILLLLPTAFAEESSGIFIDKTATALKEDFTDVTLQIGADSTIVENKTISDVVFVLDKSTSVDVREEAAAMLEELLKPLILKWYNHGGYREENVSAVLSRPVVSGLKYREFVRVRLGKVGDKLVASPLNRGSGVVTSFVKADGILDIPQGKEGCEAGETVTVRLLRRKSDIEHTLVVTGSHDPLLDELGDMLHASDSSLYMSSMGGIMAVRRREAHMAGIHLLNESDGTYNRSAVNKYFPQGGMRLVECVGRTQGLMVQKGNPKGIRSIGDLTAPGVRYVNRQKGSGTRILTDHLCRKEGIDTEKIYGYGREELTHTSVAAQIAMGTADAGMGIYSAAKLYGLDFIPVCTEQYDLLIPDCAWDTTMVQKLIEILSGPEFTRRIEKMGGYTIDRPGRVRSIK